MKINGSPPNTTPALKSLSIKSLSGRGHFAFKTIHHSKSKKKKLKKFKKNYVFVKSQMKYRKIKLLRSVQTGGVP